MRKEEESGIEKLPEGCIAHAVAFTSPLDACRSSARLHRLPRRRPFRPRLGPVPPRRHPLHPLVRPPSFRVLLQARSLLPTLRLDPHRRRQDGTDPIISLPFFISSSVSPLPIDSILHFFSNPLPFHPGSLHLDRNDWCVLGLVLLQSMWLERSTGAKCYMISARELSITWGDTPEHWRWKSLPDSRFPEVAELMKASWLEIRGRIQSKMLTPKTTYAAYLIFKLVYPSRGLDAPLQQASVNVGLRSSTTLVCLQPRTRAARERRNRMGESDPPTTPLARDDGWMELEMGEFYNEEGEDGEVAISFTETKCQLWKKGLIVQGIEIRPKHRQQ